MKALGEYFLMVVFTLLLNKVHVYLIVIIFLQLEPINENSGSICPNSSAYTAVDLWSTFSTAVYHFPIFLFLHFSGYDLKVIDKFIS